MKEVIKKELFEAQSVLEKFITEKNISKNLQTKNIIVTLYILAA